tara:strand:- start:175 stop:543 length:369 start_codon:yes stop_codon:yes gene_type:complete
MFENFRRYDEVVRSFGKIGKINGIIMLCGISFFVENIGKNRRRSAPVVESLCAGGKQLYQGNGHHIEKSHISIVVRRILMLVVAGAFLFSGRPIRFWKKKERAGGAKEVSAPVGLEERFCMV